MAILARIRATGGDNKLNSGLYNLSAPLDSPSLSRKGYRIRSPFGPVSPTGVKAAITLGAGNAGITYTAVEGGVWANTQIQVQHVVTGTNPRAILKTYTYGLASTTITVSAAIGATSLTVATTAAQGTAGAAGFNPAFYAGSAPVPGVLWVNGMRLTYTGSTGTTFTGIPASGTGSITAAITAPALVSQQVPVNLLIQVQTATTTGTSNASETAAALAQAVNADPEISDLVVASLPGTGATVLLAVAATALAAGTNKTFGDGLAYLEPLYVRANVEKTAVVDLDDRKTSRLLRRNKDKYISLGLVPNGVAS